MTEFLRDGPNIPQDQSQNDPGKTESHTTGKAGGGTGLITWIILDTINSRRHVGTADRALAAQANKVVRVVVRKSQNFVRHDVADIDDQISFPVDQHGVQTDRNLPVGRAACCFFDNGGGDDANG